MPKKSKKFVVFNYDFFRVYKKMGVFKVSLILKDFKKSWTLMNVEFFYSKFIAYQIQPLLLRF